MYTILVTDENELRVTLKERIMQRSKLVDSFHFLVDPMYKNETDMTEFTTVVMEYILPVSKKYVSETLVLTSEENTVVVDEDIDPEIDIVEDSEEENKGSLNKVVPILYKGKLEYKLKFDTNLTAEPGDIELQLTFIKTDIIEVVEDVENVENVGDIENVRNARSVRNSIPTDGDENLESDETLDDGENSDDTGNTDGNENVNTGGSNENGTGQKVTYKTVQYVRKTSPCKITIVPISAWADLIPDEALTALDRRLAKVDAQIKALADTAVVFTNEKADNIKLDTETSEIYLTANGEPLGDRISIDELGDVIIEAEEDEGMIQVII